MQPSERQLQLIELTWLPHGIAFEMRHPPPLWTAFTLPLLLLWVPVAALVAHRADPHTALLVALPLALANIGVVCWRWYRDARVTTWRVEATPDRLRVFDGDRVRLDARTAAVSVEREDRSLYLVHRGTLIGLLADRAVHDATLAWLEDRLEALKRSEGDPGDPDLRRQVRAVVDHAPTG